MVIEFFFLFSVYEKMGMQIFVLNFSREKLVTNFFFNKKSKQKKMITFVVPLTQYFHIGYEIKV